MATDTHVGKLPPEPERATLEGRNKVIGFWLFLAAESVLFASLFGTYLTLRGSNINGPPASELFSLPLVFLATTILLTSSLTSVMGVLAMNRSDFKATKLWFLVTVILGTSFLGLEIYEFYHYNTMGHSFSTDAFASAFYTLVGFHGAHVIFGIIWISSLLVRNWKRDLDLYTAPKFYLASLYWHFVDVVWVFVFSVVYLMGKVG